ncbi:hypothetical protein BT63DRAFT_484488 [Microthyrium microscopicum]|uniref:Uncharacterized protein n=1 Tax=Microthyrium microscopicum TaxID=703497 RepID=A0A6A6TSY4_9PEZI|nr:hypothetical protein BT63DRAFT_484488 [Microthyrium microscopicum]
MKLSTIFAIALSIVPVMSEYMKFYRNANVNPANCDSPVLEMALPLDGACTKFPVWTNSPREDFTDLRADWTRKCELAVYTSDDCSGGIAVAFVPGVCASIAPGKWNSMNQICEQNH